MSSILDALLLTELMGDKKNKKTMSDPVSGFKKVKKLMAELKEEEKKAKEKKEDKGSFIQQVILLMMAGPYVKKNYTSHVHANFGSILKTIYNILNVPYVNQYDATASLLQDFFTDKPDFTPYLLEIPSREVFEPADAMKKFKRNIDWRKILKGPEMDDEDDMRKDHNAVKPGKQ